MNACAKGYPRTDAAAPRAHSLRARLLVATMAWVLVSLALAGWGLRTLFQEHITQQMQAQLVLHLNQLSAAVDTDASGALSVTPIASDPRFEQPLSGLYWQVDVLSRNAEGQTTVSQDALARSRSLWDQSLPLPSTLPRAQGTRNFDEKMLRDSEGRSLIAVTRTLQLPEPDAPLLRLAVAADSAVLAERMSRFTSMLLLTLGMLALGLLVAMVIQLQFALAPLHQLRQRLRAVLNGDSQHLEGQFPSELESLVTEFNNVLDTNAEIVQRARTQAGNLAHALHTPLTIMGNAATAGHDGLAHLVQEQTQIAKRQVDYHLARARAATAARSKALRTPVKPHLQALLRTMERLHAARHLQFELGDIDPHLAFRGEEQDFYEMLGNLLDNAGKWAHQHIALHAQVIEAGEMLRLTVDDDGPGLSEPERERAFQRGVRLDEQRPGAGLGLDIVRELVHTYGGEVTASQSPLGGLRIELLLPAHLASAMP